MSAIESLAVRALGDPTGCRNCGRDSCPGCSGRDFQRVGDGCYRMKVPGYGLTLTIDRLRRKWDELVGELTVRCELPGARTIGDSLLSVADVNLSNQRARQERAKWLAGRAQAQGADWPGIVEEFAALVIAADRDGRPAVLLRDVERPKPDDVYSVDGLPLLARHPTILFGDGGAAKSYLSLYCAGKLERAGVRVGLFDWELAAEDHRERLGRLFGDDLPGVRYARCDRPLAHEVDRLRRIVRDERLQFVILDSVAFACDGPPEAAEVASRYFQATRQLGALGTLHIAHVSKAEGADQKPFGSAFWHNGARATWFAKLADPMPGGNRITVALLNRKANLGGLRPAVGFEITFGDERTTFRRVDIADVPDLARELSVRQRMAHVLRHGAMAPEDLATEIQADAETVKRTARRHREQFTVLTGGSLALLERRT